MSLRDYQELAINQIREEFKKGNTKVLLVMPTGSGKTKVFTHMMKEAFKRDFKSVMYVRGRQLVEQAHQRLMSEKVPHGVYMANHWARNFHAKIQLASIDTADSRGNYPEAYLVIVDEAHMATSQQYKDAIASYPPGTYFVSVTATPWMRESLLHLAEVVIKPTSFQKLVDEGYLIAPRYFGAKPPDFKGLKKSKGEFVTEQLRERMSVLSADIVQTWIEKAEGRPTLLFAVNVAHSKQICEEFNKAGIKAEHIDASIPVKDREAIISRMKTGETKVATSVRTMTTGVDIPFLGCISDAAPTLSYNLHIQKLGRGTRPFYASGFDLSEIWQRLAAIQASDKKDFIILDHAGNLTRHGYMEDEPEIFLEGVEKVDTGKAPKQCKTCYLLYDESFCPVCGPEIKTEKEKRQIDIEREVKLIELNIHDKGTAAEMVKFVAQKKELAKKMSYKQGWVYYQVKEQYGEEIADSIFPTHKTRLRFKTFK